MFKTINHMQKIQNGRKGHLRANKGQGWGLDNMGKMSREKGKRGERAFAALCRAEGYAVHRSAQYRGNTGRRGMWKDFRGCMWRLRMWSG